MDSTKMSKIDWSGFVELVQLNQRFALTTHIRPDGDALGSEMAMAAILKSLGKDVLVLNASAMPRHFQFLDPNKQAKELGVNATAEMLEACDVLIILDTTAWAQLGAMADVIRQSKIRKVVIDHHVSADDLDAALFKNAEAEATGRLVIEAADALGVPLTPEIAQAAFVSMTTDTGWFRFASTRADTYRIAARLVDAGVVPDQIYKALYENDSLGRLRLIGQAMGHTQAERDGRLIYTWLTLADFDAAGAVPSDSEDLINLMLAVGGTEVAVIFVEQRSGGFKISFRSRSAVDCAAIAGQFGGGGHKKAAGAFIPGNLEAARAKALDAVRAAMEKGGHY